jgi:hypothetical protein
MSVAIQVLFFDCNSVQEVMDLGLVANCTMKTRIPFVVFLMVSDPVTNCKKYMLLIMKRLMD